MPRKMRQEKYPLLKARMSERGVDSQEYLGKLLGLSAAPISKRLSGQCEWRVSEMYTVMDELDIPYGEMHRYFPKDGEGMPDGKSDDLNKILASLMDQGDYQITVSKQKQKLEEKAI